jgi:hypothetical protein
MQLLFELIFTHLRLNPLDEGIEPLQHGAHMLYSQKLHDDDDDDDDDSARLSAHRLKLLTNYFFFPLPKL